MTATANAPARTSSAADTQIFVDNAARERIANWFSTFREALPFETESRVVETEEGKAHVLVAGPVDAPPLVVLHGALASSAHLLPELGDLVKRHRIYAVDVIGQSVMSADKRIDVKGDAYGKWLTNVVDALGLESFVLFGVSWGGFVSIRFAAVAPKRVKALILFVPAGVVTGPFWAGLTKVAWPMFTYKFSPSEKRLKKLVEGMFSTPDERWTQYFGDAVRSYRMDMRIPPLTKPEDVAGLEAPVLVFGAADDVSFPGDALTRRAKELFPRVEIQLLEGCKHSPPTTAEFRAQTAERVTAFLQRNEV